MILFILKMDKEKAKEICSWKYTSPYNAYNIPSTEESLTELLNSSYYVAVDENNELVGFYYFGKCAQVSSGREFGAYRDTNVVDIGLGLRPDLCGKGNGLEFLRKCTVLGETLYSNKNFRITLPTFNKRAITVCKQFGFKAEDSFEIISKGNKASYITMTCTID